MSENEKVSCSEERPNPHPVIKDRIKSLTDIIEDTSGICDKADEAEPKIIRELRRMGNEITDERASGKEIAEAEETGRNCPDMTSHGKKKLFWHTTFGEVAVSERVFMKDGHLVRPFSESCEAGCGGYSLPLRRRMTDFGADVPFGKVSEKFGEHYGISI